jgi:hypothetical protein
MRPSGDETSVCCAIAGKQRSNAAIVLKILDFMLSVFIRSFCEFQKFEMADYSRADVF